MVSKIFLLLLLLLQLQHFFKTRLIKAANWIIREIIHLLSPNLVHRGSLTFWIDSKGCCCCICSIAAATAALFLNWIIWEVIHILLPNLVYTGSLTVWIDSKGPCCCSCSTAAATVALFPDIRLVKAANWIILEVIHLSSPNLVYRGNLIFWIDSKGCCCCSCSIAAAAAELFTDKMLEKAANWIIQEVIYLLSIDFIHTDSLTIWIDSKGCYCCSCSTAAALLLQLRHFIQT